MQTEQWINFIGYIHLIAGAQGLFLAVILKAYPTENKVPNRSLSLFIFSFSVIILGIGLGATGLYQQVPHLIRIGAPFLLLLGPSLLFYMTAIRIGKIPSIQKFHLIPFGIYLFALLPFYFSTAEEKIFWVEVSMRTTQTDAWVNLLMVTHLFGYLSWVYYLLVSHPKKISKIKTDLADTDLGWLRNLIYIMILCSVIALILFSLSAAGVLETLISNYLIGIVMAIIVYVMGYRSLITPRIFGDRDYRAWKTKNRWRLFWGDLKFNPDAKADNQFVNEEKKLLDQLLKYMETEKPYRNSDLSLAKLASQSGIPQYMLSRIINEHLGQNFFDFINHYRVRDICDRLADPDQHAYTILSLAMDAGFNSKSSFNTAFRKNTGITPSEYKKQQMTK